MKSTLDEGHEPLSPTLSNFTIPKLTRTSPRKNKKSRKIAPAAAAGSSATAADDGPPKYKLSQGILKKQYEEWELYKDNIFEWGTYVIGAEPADFIEHVKESTEHLHRDMCSLVNRSMMMMLKSYTNAIEFTLKMGAQMKNLPFDQNGKVQCGCCQFHCMKHWQIPGAPGRPSKDFVEVMGMLPDEEVEEQESSSSDNEL